MRWPAIVGCVLGVASAGFTAASAAVAIPPPRPFRNGGVAFVNGGVLWADEGELRLEGPRWGSRLLGRTGFLSEAPISASATATAGLAGVDSRQEPYFLASVLPRRRTRGTVPGQLAGAGCTWWAPSADSVVVLDELVAAGECQEVTEHPRRTPLLIRNLRGGRWRVLSWLAGVVRPRFAAEGPLLAIGTRRSGRGMSVVVLDIATGARIADFTAPEGELAFASARRLVVEVPEPVHNEARPRVGLRLYSTRGGYLGARGSVTEPLISGMHVVGYTYGTLWIRDLAGGVARPVAGFDVARELQAFAFRWPELVMSETTSRPLLPSEVRCWSGSYAPPSRPFLRTIDLSRREPFDAPPPVVKVQPSAPLTNCGPVPP